MNTFTPGAPGWYPHPDGSGLVWWNGQAWDHAVPAGYVAEPTAAPTYAPVQYASAPPAPYAGPPAAPYAGPSAGPFVGPSASPYAGPQAGPYAGPYAPPASGGLYGPETGRPRARGGNTYAFIALAVSAVYLLVALNGHIVIFGVLPAVMTARSFRARERLAPVALIATVIAIGIAIARMSGTG